jgi:proteasome accessory factor B
VDEVAAPTGEPKVRATEPAFGPLLAAVQAGQAVTFDYRRSPPTDVMTRTVEPWGVVSWRGRWYVVGKDRDRDAPRCFRLTRVVGDVRTIGQPGVVERPAGINLMGYVVGAQQDGRPSTPARLWVADGRAQGVRRQATVVGRRTLDGQTGDEVTVELRFPESAAGWLAGHGPDVVVLEPEVLRKAVRERLFGALESQVAVGGVETGGRVGTEDVVGGRAGAGDAGGWGT